MKTNIKQTVILVLSAIYAIVVVTLDGNLTLLGSIAGLILMVLLMWEFIKVIKEEMKKHEQ